MFHLKNKDNVHSFASKLALLHQQVNGQIFYTMNFQEIVRIFFRNNKTKFSKHGYKKFWRKPKNPAHFLQNQDQKFPLISFQKNSHNILQDYISKKENSKYSLIFKK